MQNKQEFKNFILEQLNGLENIVCRPMMGEFLLYYNDILFGGIYNNRLLIKIVESTEKYNLPTAIPYPGAKSMYQIEDLDDKERIAEIIVETCKYLPKKVKK